MTDKQAFYGRIQNWHHRGFGFAAREDGQPDIFVHITHVAESVEELRIGQRIRFEVGTNPRNGKLEAIDVQLID